MMENQNSGPAKGLGVLLIVCGIVGIVLWVPVCILGALLNMNSYPGAQQAFGATNILIMAALAASLVGAILTLLIGIRAVKATLAPGGKGTLLALLAIVLCLPGCVVLVLLQWAYFYIPALVIGVVPQALYLYGTRRKK